MNAMKRFALLGTALMSFLTGCGTQQENTASSQTIPKAAVSSDTVKEIAQTGMSTAVPDDYLQPIEQAGTVTQVSIFSTRATPTLQRRTLRLMYVWERVTVSQIGKRCRAA